MSDPDRLAQPGDSEVADAARLPLTAARQRAREASLPSFDDERVALVHPWLTNQGGSERVLEAFCRAFPAAAIFTSVYNPAALPAFATRDVRTSFLQHWPLAKTRHQLFPLLRRRAFESMDLSDFDIVLTSDHCEAKGVITGPETLHIAYIHTPTRYYWSDYHRYLDRPGFGRLDGPLRAVMPSLTSSMRQWDYLAAQRPDQLLANSRAVQKRIEKYYRRPSTVLHAPVDTRRFAGCLDRGDHLLVVSRLIPYKRVDLAVAACRELDLPLRVVGDGPELAALRAQAGPRTTFLGPLDDEAVAREYGRAAAFLFTANEDFGITPLEAMASGTPVLALRRGGAMETVVDGVTGAFFDDQSVASLVEALRAFSPSDYDPGALEEQAAAFDEVVFTRRLRELVHASWLRARAA